MLRPLRYDLDTPIFSSTDIQVFGLPLHYGYEKYLVIDDNSEDHLQPQNHKEYTHFTKKHHYSRIARFNRVVRSLFGESSAVLEPKSIVGVVQQLLNPFSENPYQDCFKILKHYNLPKLYAQIPAILFQAHGIRLLKTQKPLSELFQEVCTRFKVFEQLFFELDDDRKYFPNLKFTALRILESLGVENKCIPHLRTKRKLLVMEKLFLKMEKVNSERRLLTKEEPAVKRILGAKKKIPTVRVIKQPQERKQTSKSILKQYARTWKIPKF